MADLLMAAQAAQSAPAIPTHTIIQHTIEGVSYMTALIAAAVTFVMGGGLGMWFGKRGVSGMQADLTAAHNEINTLKAKVGA